MKFPQNCILFCIFLATNCSAMPVNNKKSFVLSIIHFSDFHARFVEVSPAGGLCYEQEKDKCVGGIARVATIVKKLKKIRPNPIFLNSGDCFQGSLYYELFRDNITVRFMNKLPQDVHTIGNHDLDENVPGLVSYVKQLNSPVVVTNIDNSDEPSMQNLYTNSTIIQKSGKNIGVIGVIYSDTDTVSKTIGKLKFLNEVKTINLEANKLKAKGIEIIIVLSHCGIERDKIIASNCPQVDVVVGGHSHVLLYNGQAPSNEQVYGEYPIVITQKDSNRKVLIVHASAFTKYMGDIQIVFDERNEVAFWEGNPIYLDQTVQEDSSFVEMLKEWKIDVAQVGNRLIGKTLVYLNGSCDMSECNSANLVTDAMVDSYAEEAAISCLPAFNIQNSIPEGLIYYEDIYMTIPYNYTWNLIEFKGSDLVQVLVESVENYSTNGSVNHSFLQWSGLKVVYDLKNEENKVVSAKVRCLDCDHPEFEDVNDDQWYRIVVASFLLEKVFKTFSEKHRLIKTGNTRDVEILTAYIEKKQTVYASIESRIVFL